MDLILLYTFNFKLCVNVNTLCKQNYIFSVSIVDPLKVMVEYMPHFHTKMEMHLTNSLEIKNGLLMHKNIGFSNYFILMSQLHASINNESKFG